MKSLSPRRNSPETENTQTLKELAIWGETADWDWVTDLWSITKQNTATEFALERVGGGENTDDESDHDRDARTAKYSFQCTSLVYNLLSNRPQEAGGGEGKGWLKTSDQTSFCATPLDSQFVLWHSLPLFEAQKHITKTPGVVVRGRPFGMSDQTLLSKTNLSLFIPWRALLQRRRIFGIVGRETK